MEFRVFESAQQLAQAEAERIAALLRDKPDALICIAAGHTSLPVFDALLAMQEKGALSFAQAKFVAMDEWLGMNRDTPDSCGDFLVKNFLSRADFAKENVRLADGCAQDVQAECEGLTRFIADNGGLDYVLLGMGMNGHLALNEPGVDFKLGAHVTGLDEVTQKVGQKYFAHGAALRGGLTLGVADLLAARQVALHVTGDNKADIAARLMTEPVSNALPATAVRALPGARIWMDKAAAGTMAE